MASEATKVLVVVVSRLVGPLKLEGLLTTCEAIGHLGQSRRIRLIIVGGGPMKDQVAAHAALANANAGREASCSPERWPIPAQPTLPPTSSLAWEDRHCEA